MANGGGGRERAIAAAVNFVKFVCKTGKSKNFLKSNPGHTVAPEKRARACANVAAWNRLVACMRSGSGGKAATETYDGPRDKRGLDALLLSIDMLNLADDLALEQQGFAPIAMPDELWTPLATADSEPVLAEADGKALCHAGTCLHGGAHDMAEFMEEFGSKAAVTETEEGLIIKGLAAAFSPDREAEAFEPGAFEAGLKAFMENPVLAYNHAHKVIDTVKGSSNYVQLGVVRSLNQTKAGLEMEAFVPKPTGGFLEDVYDKIKRGYMKGLSVGGKFYKHYTPQGWKIYQADLQEISVAPKPINPATLIHSVSAGKAMTDDGVGWEPIENLTDDLLLFRANQEN